MSLSNEVEILQKKAANYDALKEELDSVREKVADAIGILKSVSVVNVEFGHSDKADIQAFVNRIYEEMKTTDGMQVTAKLLAEKVIAYGVSLSEKQISYVIVRLKLLKGVHSVKDGRNVRLWYNKSVSHEKKVEMFGEDNIKNIKG